MSCKFRARRKFSFEDNYIRFLSAAMPDFHPAVIVLFLSGLAIFWLTPITAWWMLSDRQDRNASIWFSGAALYALVSTIFVFGAYISPTTRVLINSALSSASILCLLESLRREISERPTPWQRYTTILLVEIVLLALVNWQFQNNEICQAVHLFIISSIEIVLLVVANRVRKHFQSKALWVIMTMFAAFIASNLSRVVELWLTGRFSALTDFTFLASTGLVINYLSVVSYTYGYWGFVVEKNRVLLVRATEASALARASEALAMHKEQVAKEMLRERTEHMQQLASIGKLAQAGALSASIAHEINQPLAAIQLNAEESMRWALEAQVPEPLQKLIQRIERDNQRASDVVKRVRAMFKQSNTVVRKQYLSETIRTVLTFLDSRIRQEKVQVQTSLHAHDPIEFSVGELEHILMNLISNALDAMQDSAPKTRKIDIQTWQEQSNTYLSVSDSGPGVAADRLSSIFELAETSKADGMGLGLWLARYIAERNNSFLWHDQHHAEGARFVLRLPSTAAAPHATAPFNTD